MELSKVATSRWEDGRRKCMAAIGFERWRRRPWLQGRRGLELGFFTFCLFSKRNARSSKLVSTATPGGPLPGPGPRGLPPFTRLKRIIHNPPSLGLIRRELGLPLVPRRGFPLPPALLYRLGGPLWLHEVVHIHARKHQQDRASNRHDDGEAERRHVRHRLRGGSVSAC